MKPELKKLLVLNLPYLLFVYLFAKCGQAYRLAAGADASAKLLHLTSGISAAFANPLPSLHPFDLCVGVAGAVAVRLIVYSKGKNAKKYRKGEEYGSARWGTAKDIAPYIDPKFENNILLTQTERLTMTGRPKDPKTARNKNVLVIGGSGSGKTRFYVKPNLMQCFPTSDYPTSFVVTDPKGTLVLETGQMFQRAGYRVKILNTINFSKSMKYNPFVYIGSLLSLWFQTLVVGLTMNILSICIFLVTYGRMIEIYVVTALGPIPLATMGSSEWRSTGQNYLKSLLALGFQAFLIMIVVGIYAVLIRNISGAADIAGAIWGCMGYTVLLCFCLFKTGSISKSVFGAH